MTIILQVLGGLLFYFLISLVAISLHISATKDYSRLDFSGQPTRQTTKKYLRFLFFCWPLMLAWEIMKGALEIMREIF